MLFRRLQALATDPKSSSADAAKRPAFTAEQYGILPLRLSTLQSSGATEAARSHQRNRRIAFTALMGVASKGVGILTSLVSVPLSINYLGEERYGLWMAISSLIAMLGFADFGMGNGLLNAVSAAHGRRDIAGAKASISSCFYMLCALATIGAIGFTALYPIVSWSNIYNVTAESAVREAPLATTVLIGAFLIGLPLGVGQRAQMAIQEGYRTNTWMAFGSLLSLFSVILVIHLEASLPVLVLAVSFGPLVAAVIIWCDVFFLRHRDIAPAGGSFSKAKALELGKTGFQFMILQILSLAAAMSDNMIISHLYGASTVAPYAVAQKLFSVTLVAPFILAPMWPAFSEALARGDMRWAATALKRSVAIAVGSAIVISLPLVVFGAEIIERWTRLESLPSHTLLLGFAVWSVVTSYIGTITIFLNGAGLMAKQAFVFGIASCMAIFIKATLCWKFGPEFTVWGAPLGYAIFYMVPATKLACRRLHLS